MEASNKIALLRHSDAEINVRLYESYKAFYAENPPLDETGDISHCSLDSSKLFVEQKDQREPYSPEDLAKGKDLPVQTGRPPAPLHPRSCRPLLPPRQPHPINPGRRALATSLHGGFWSRGAPGYDNSRLFPRDRGWSRAAAPRGGGQMGTRNRARWSKVGRRGVLSLSTTLGAPSHWDTRSQTLASAPLPSVHYSDTRVHQYMH